jgi:hypothetical protein
MSVVMSVLIGMSGLVIAAIAALLLTTGRADLAPEELPRVQRVASLTVVLQIGHLAEELTTHFFTRFPEFFGLTAWPLNFFLVFNAVWIAVWVLAIWRLPSWKRYATFPLWFLGIASAANGVIHPILALAASDYFPGLWTSPIVGTAGVVLVHRLTQATDGIVTRLG